MINDLRAEDAIYHKTCNSDFRALKGKPTSKPFGIKKTTHPERGRPSNARQETVLMKLLNTSGQGNDDEQITISELTEMTGKLYAKNGIFKSLDETKVARSFWR